MVVWYVALRIYVEASASIKLIDLSLTHNLSLMAGVHLSCVNVMLIKLHSLKDESINDRN